MVDMNSMVNFLNPISKWIENAKLVFEANVLGYSLAVCTIVGTAAIFLKLLGFKTGKWALLSGSTLLFIIIMLG